MTDLQFIVVQLTPKRYAVEHASTVMTGKTLGRYCEYKLITSKTDRDTVHRWLKEISTLDPRDYSVDLQEAITDE